MLVHRIYFYEVFAEEKEALLRYLPSDWHVEMTESTIQESGHCHPPCAILSIRTQSIIPPDWSDHITAVLSRSAGFDHLLAYRAQTGSTACLGHLYRYSGRAVAEQAALMWMALLRRLPRQMASIHSFQRNGLTGSECAGRTLAICGVGDIGYQVARIGKGLDMRVLGCDINPRHRDISYVSKDEAIRRAHVLVCAMNLNESNQDYFSLAALSQVPAQAIFINVARGEFVRSTDLLTLLQVQKLGGVGLDVFAAENLIAPSAREGRETKHPEYAAFRELLKRDDVIMTPHNAFNTLEAVDRKSAQSIDQLKHFFSTGAFDTYTTEESFND